MRFDRVQWYYTPYDTYNASATLLIRERVPVSTEIEPCWPGRVDGRRALAVSGGGEVAELATVDEDQVQVQAQAQRDAAASSVCVDWSFKALCHEADDATIYTEMEIFVN